MITKQTAKELRRGTRVECLVTGIQGVFEYYIDGQNGIVWKPDKGDTKWSHFSQVKLVTLSLKDILASPNGEGFN